MSIWNKFTAIAGAALLSVGFAGSAMADVNSFLEPGSNLFEDDSGELVFRWDVNSGTFVPVTDSLAEGDIVVGVYDITWINEVGNALEPTNELTGIYAAAITGISSVGTGLDLGGGPEPLVDLTFGALDQATANALGLPSTGDGQVMWGYEDANNNLDLLNDSTLSALSNATDGTLVLVADMIGSDFFLGDNVYQNLSAYGIGDAGVEIRGNFTGGLSISYYGFAGELIYGAQCTFASGGGQTCHDMTISGTLLVSELAGFGVQNDAQFRLSRIPEPGTLGILGMGLLGLGAAGRRRRS